MVFQGCAPTRAKFFLFSRRFITEDLPTFDFPANTTEGTELLINCFGLAADFINSALLTLIAAIVTYCLTARSSFCFAAGIAAYSSVRPLSDYDLRFLYFLFLYPEKFWKISNHYHNHRKSWISPKMEEKLLRLLEQNAGRRIFLQQFAALLNL